jgi:uncharacterized membrane protein
VFAIAITLLILEIKVPHGHEREGVAFHVFNLLNVFFLLSISFLPFPTAVLGEFMNDAANRQTAVSLYAFGFLLAAFAWCLLWLYGSRDYRLIDRRLDPAFVRYLSRQYGISIALYLSAFVISFIHPVTCLALNIGLTLLYLLPSRKPVYRAHH